MQNLDFNFIFLTIIMIVFMFVILKPYLEKRNEIRLLEIQNQKIDLMMKLDPNTAEDEIDKLVKKYINEYVLNNFIVNNVNYIQREEIEIMIKQLDKKIILELSELYIFYIKLIREVSNETDIIKYINNKVKEHVLIFVTEFNKDR